VQTLQSLGPGAAIFLAYEAGPTGFVLARCARAAGVEVVVVAPSKVLRPVNRQSKTDRLDSDRLADLLVRGLLKSIAIPTPEQERQRSVIRQRQQLGKEIRRAKQRIKSYLLLHGIAEPRGLSHWSRESVRALEALPLPEELRLVLGCQLRVLAMLEGERDHLDRELKGILEQKKSTARPWSACEACRA
jgi:transposase